MCIAYTFELNVNRQHSCLILLHNRFLYSQDYKSQMVDDVNDVRIIGAVTVAILLCITFAGMSWEAKVYCPLLLSSLISQCCLL